MANPEREQLDEYTFRTFATSPFFWRCTGHDLKAASDKLWSLPLEGGVGHGRAAMLLRALAVENYLKGLAACRMPTIFRDDGVYWFCKSHDQCALAGKAQLEISAEERAVLEELTQ